MRYIGFHEVAAREKLHRVAVAIGMIGAGVALSAWTFYGVPIAARIAGGTLTTCGLLFGWASIRYRP